jgi:hypothetical protein
MGVYDVIKDIASEIKVKGFGKGHPKVGVPSDPPEPRRSPAEDVEPRKPVTPGFGTKGQKSQLEQIESDPDVN